MLNISCGFSCSFGSMVILNFFPSSNCTDKAIPLSVENVEWKFVPIFALPGYDIDILPATYDSDLRYGRRNAV